MLGSTSDAVTPRRPKRTAAAVAAHNASRALEEENLNDDEALGLPEPLSEPSRGRSTRENHGDSQSKRRKTDVKVDDCEKTFKSYLESLITDSMADFEELGFTRKEWRRMFEHARALMTRTGNENEKMESVKLLAISLTNPDTDVLKIDMEQWNKDLPFYEAKALQLPKHLLGQIFFYSAERYVRAYECMDETVNPFTALAFSSAQELKRVYPPTNETVNAYSVGIRVLVAMAGCKRLFSNGLSTLELWDIAFSRQLLNKNHIIELLRDDPGYASPVRNDDAEFVKLIGSSEFLEVVSREAYTFILEAASKFKLPIPALFYDRLGSVLEELGVAGNDVERFKDKTRALLEKALYDPNTPNRSILLAELFAMTKTACQAVNKYPCIAMFGRSGSGKSTFLNAQIFAQLPWNEGSDADQNAKYIQNAVDIRSKMFREDPELLTTNYSTLLSLLRTTGASGEYSVDAEDRRQHVEEKFQKLLEKAKRDFRADQDRKARGSVLLEKMIAWNQSSDPGDEPPELLLPAKVPGTNSTTACVTYLAHGPVFAVGVWYKSRERILAEGTQLWTKANGSAFGSSERRMFRLYLAKVLAIPEPNWMDLGRWMDIGAELPSEEAFRAEFERAINDLPDDHGFKLVKSADRLRLAVGLGDSLKSDLGHCANFLKSIQQDDKEAFLDTIFVVAPLPDLDKTGALFIDAPGTNDVYVLRSRRCEQALEEAEVVLHLTGSYGVAQSDHDRPYLAPYWKNFRADAPPAERKYLQHLARGVHEDITSWQVATRVAYQLMAGPDFDTSAIFLDYYDLANKDNRNIIQMRKILEQAAKRGRSTIHSSIAITLEVANNVIRVRRSLVSVPNLGEIFDILSTPSFHETLGRDIKKALDALQTKLLAHAAKVLAPDSLLDACFGPTRPNFEGILRISGVFAHLPKSDRDPIFKQVWDVVNKAEELFRAVGGRLSQDNRDCDEHRSIVRSKIQEHVLRAIADTSHGLDEKQTVAELFGAKSQQLFAPAFDKTSQRAKTSSPISKLRRKFQNLLNQDPFPNEMNQYVMQFLTEFATDGADVLAYAFEPLQRFEFPALFEEDLTDPGRVDAANDLWRRTHKLSKKLCRYFKDPQNVEV